MDKLNKYGLYRDPSIYQERSDARIQFDLLMEGIRDPTNRVTYACVQSAERLLAENPDFPNEELRRLSPEIARKHFESLLDRLREMGQAYGSCNGEGVRREAEEVAQRYGFAIEPIQDVYWKHCSPLEDTRSQKQEKRSLRDKVRDFFDNLP